MRSQGMQARPDRFARLQRLRREGRALDDQKYVFPRRLYEEDEDEPLKDARDLVLRYGG